jgi:hypothetical protein
MAALTVQYSCGVVAESFEPKVLADSLSRLDADTLRKLKEASHQAAQFLCFEQDGQIIESEIIRLSATGG